jgi:site-specific DNA-methyltransferase (adenine-specific)
VLGRFEANSVYAGDSRSLIRLLPDHCVQCIVTSPPYWRKRDYGVRGQIGLEKNPFDYVQALVLFFAEARRVLRSDGVMWLVLGDGYFGTHVVRQKGAKVTGRDRTYQATENRARWKKIPDKQLVGMPWRVAFALQEAGWFLRASVIWHKPHASPEPTARDRPTRSHENVFLFSKSPSYFFAKSNGVGSVWTIPIANNSQGRQGHYAAFPEALVDLMVRMSTHEGDLVFDPFIGTGTTGIVAERLGRRWLGFDLCPVVTA